MPAVATLSTPAAVEMSAVRPRVTVNGQEYPNIYCMSVEQSTGTTASRAMLRFFGSTDWTGPSTLCRAPRFRYGARVKVFDEDRVFFLGQIVKRTDQGRQDMVLWEAVDDRIFLEHLFVRGCFVAEKDTGGTWHVKFVRRYVARTNPSGQWNCIYAPIAGPTETINLPVFAPLASLCRNYNTPDDDYSGTVAAGVVVPWTPRRFLQYLWLIGGAGSGWNIEGIDPAHWRSIYQSDRIKWELASITGLVGKDPVEGSWTTTYGKVGDPLDRKMPDMTFQGERVLGAMDKTLRSAGTHGLRLRYGSITSSVDFYPVGFTAVTEAATSVNGGPYNIPLQRGGPVDDINTAHDFDMSEDVSRTCESILGEGAPVRVETQVEYLTSAPDDASLKPAWTTAELTAFLWCINGANPTGDPGSYAAVPDKAGSTTTASFTPADGTGGKPWALPRSSEAVALARSYYPRVLRAFRLDSTKLDAALSGYGAPYANTSFYPRLQAYRPILPEQLQFLVKELLPSYADAESNWLLNRIPIRIQVKGTGDSVWREAQFSSGIRQTPDGLLWLDSIAENRDAQAECLYEYSLFNFLSQPTLKNIRINLAFPMDHRLLKYITQSDSIFDPGYISSMGGLPMFYLDAPEGFHENHQVNSEPMGLTLYPAGTGTTARPINRLLPPGSESDHLYYAARRKLWSLASPSRRSSWKLIGIRPEWKAGDWASKVKVRGLTFDADFVLNSPIENVVYDFQAQETRLGGLIMQGAI